MRAAAFDLDTGHSLKAKGPWKLTYSKATVPRLCLFICWQRMREAILSEEQPGPAEVGTQLGSPGVLSPLLLLTGCVVLISYRWLLALQTGLVQQLRATIK